MDNKYNKYNKNGDIMCYSPGCRKHTKLKLLNGKFYCKFHLDHPEGSVKFTVKSDSRFSTPKLILFDNCNRELCHAYGCKTYKNLTKFAGGLFCEVHKVQLLEIRSKINHQDTPKEFEARKEEVLFRKIFDPGHVKYAYKK